MRRATSAGRRSPAGGWSQAQAVARIAIARLGGPKDRSRTLDNFRAATAVSRRMGRVEIENLGAEHGDRRFANRLGPRAHGPPGAGDEAVGDQVGERTQHEAPTAQLGVREDEAVVAPNDVAVEGQVDVDDARAPALRGLATHGEFDLFDDVQKVQRRQRRLDLDRRVHEVRLVRRAEGLRPVQPSPAHGPQPGNAQAIDGLADPRHRIVEVPAERQVSQEHGAECRAVVRRLPRRGRAALDGTVVDELDVEELTRSLIDIPSVTNREGPISSFIERELEARGWSVRSREVPVDAGFEGPVEIPRRNVLATANAGRPRVVLTTHLDTVPPHIPYADDDVWIYGRGACDAKGIFAAMWVAAERLREAGHAVGLLGVVGEETQSLGAKAVPELLPEVDWIIDGEPTDGIMASGAKGILSLRLSAAGTPGHSAYPERGDSAIHRLVDALARLLAAELPADPAYGATTVNVGVLEGGVAPNVIAPSASARVMIRLGAPADVVDRAIRAMLPDGIDVEERSRSDPHPIDVVAGQPHDVVRFGSDVPYLRRVGRPLLVGPGSIHDAHTRHERIRRQDLRSAVEQYVQVAEALLGTDPGR